jgi:ATP-binding cassette subfamily G (WHITE) protein 2 (SNQ2)
MRFFPILPQLGTAREKRDLIRDFSGVVRDGEMLLVLGRPGSGCSTFLKAITNKIEGFACVEGEVSYGGISAKEQARNYRGEVNYNEEDDQHFPMLTVQQTLEFSLLNKTKKNERGDIPVIINALLKIFGISHTRYTLVGDVSNTEHSSDQQFIPNTDLNTGFRAWSFWWREETCIDC